MMDAASLDAPEIILLSGFNIDLHKPQTSWLDITSSYNIVQLVNSPTRITASSKTIIDHIYTTHEQNIRELCVPIFGCSDHLPVCLTWSKKGTKFPKLVISIALIGLFQNSTGNNSYLTFSTLIFTTYAILLTQKKHLNIGYMPLIQYMTNMHHLDHKE